MMTRDEDIAFTEFLNQKAAEAEALGYRPTKFKQMLGSQGGDATVRQLLAKGKPSEGFTRLFQLGRLDLTVEALVVETRWRTLIDPILVKQAERLLKEVRYPFNPFVGSAPAAAAASAPTLTPTASTSAPAQTLQPVTPQPLPRKNTRTFSDFCAFLGAELTNPRDRWCGYNRERGFALFTIWADELHGDRYVLWNWVRGAEDKRAGATELKQVLKDVMIAGHAAYGVRCEAKDLLAATRERRYFDEDQLLVLRLSEEDDRVVATLVGEIPAVEVAAGRHGVATPFDSAIDDLGSPPSGSSSPARTPTKGGSGYRRDPAVRDYVIRRAHGHCEYCRARGFEMTDGSYYVEAHHVIALSAQGPDRVDNVIALCPEHHREAHYGKGAEALEQAFLEKLKEVGT